MGWVRDWVSVSVSEIGQSRSTTTVICLTKTGVIGNQESTVLIYVDNIVLKMKLASIFVVTLVQGQLS